MTVCVSTVTNIKELICCHIKAAVFRLDRYSVYKVFLMCFLVLKK